MHAPRVSMLAASVGDADQHGQEEASNHCKTGANEQC